MSIFKLKQKPVRKFYVKVSGKYVSKIKGLIFIMDKYFTENGSCSFEFTYRQNDAMTFTDKYYDDIKYLLPQNHTLELVK